MLKNYLVVSCTVWGYGIFYIVCKNDWSLFSFFSMILRWTQITLRITRLWRSHWQVPMVMFVVLIIKKYLKFGKEKVRANALEDLTRQMGKFKWLYKTKGWEVNLLKSKMLIILNKFLFVLCMIVNSLNFNFFFFFY